MAKFKQKPITVEAVQWVPGNTLPDVTYGGRGTFGDPEYYLTHNGSIERLFPGDWIVTEGTDKYVMSNDRFVKLFEPLTEETAPNPSLLLG